MKKIKEYFNHKGTASSLIYLGLTALQLARNYLLTLAQISGGTVSGAILNTTQYLLLPFTLFWNFISLPGQYLEYYLKLANLNRMVVPIVFTTIVIFILGKKVKHITIPAYLHKVLYFGSLIFALIVNITAAILTDKTIAGYQVTQPTDVALAQLKVLSLELVFYTTLVYLLYQLIKNFAMLINKIYTCKHDQSNN